MIKNLVLIDQYGNLLRSTLEEGDVGAGHAEDHDHDGSPTQQLTQANTHQSPDTDSATSALHHTLGSGANQAAAGNHSHVGGGGGGGTWTATVVKTTDEDVESSATLQDDDELFFPATSGKTFLWEAVLIYASPEGTGTTADIKLAFGEDTSSVRGAWKTMGFSLTLAFTDQNGLTNQTTIAQHGTGATKLPVYVRGTHIGAGGTFRLLWAQNTSSSENTRIYAGSLLRYEQID